MGSTTQRTTKKKMPKKCMDLKQFIIREAYLKERFYKVWVALKHHRTHKDRALDFARHAYLKQLYFDESDYIVVMKSTQCGVSEYLLVTALTKAIQGRSVFYVLPTADLVGRFVRNRVDKSIQHTPYYAYLDTVTRMSGMAKRSDSMSLKDIGNGTIAFVGSNSSAPFTEFPADDLIIDELDECDQTNIEMGVERLSHSHDKRQVRVANPTLEGYGIDIEYGDTCKFVWHVKCSNCGKTIVPDFFHHVVQDVGDGRYVIRDTEWEHGSQKDICMICEHCGKPFNRYVDGEWVATNPGNHKHGYQVSKLWSANTRIKEIVDRFGKGLANDSIMQRVYNADLGLPYTAAGSKLTLSDLKEACCDDWGNNDTEMKGLGVMGIDVGKDLNIIIGKLQGDKTINVVSIRVEEPSVRSVLNLIKQYKVAIVVMDALPEEYLVRKIKAATSNVFACYYGDAKKREPVDKSRNIVVGRTQTIDNMREEIIVNRIKLPANALSVPGFTDQMMASTRVLDKKENKTAKYIWTEGSKADHYFHAMNYMVIAARVALHFKR